MRGLPEDVTRDGVKSAADVGALVREGRFGHTEQALRGIEALIPALARTPHSETLLLALYGRAVLLHQLGAGSLDAIAACDVLERAGHEHRGTLWSATGCALRARVRVDSGDIGGATGDLARADAELATEDLSSPVGYLLLDALAAVYSRLRLHDRLDDVRTRIEHSITSRSVPERAAHWSTWACELAARALEPVAGGSAEPDHELLGRAAKVAAQVDGLPEADVPLTLHRGARGVRGLAAAYRGRPSEALRLLGPDAFGTVADLPLVERQIVSLAAMRAHALVGSLATARNLDDAAATPPATLPHLVLEVCRTRERLWLETYAGGDVIPVLHRMTELLVRLGWRGMDLVADTARQALEHQALRTESRTDALTGVGNRRALDEELRQLLRFSSLPLALILVDIDHFKEVNDRFTHVVGDEVLRRVAASLTLQLRPDDKLLRYGGDEFVVLLPGTGDEEATAVAHRMAAAVSARRWHELAEGLVVTATTGVAALWSLTGRRPDADAERLFRRADELLLEAKRDRSGAPSAGRRHAAAGEPGLPPSEPPALEAPPPVRRARSRRAAGPADAPHHGAGPAGWVPRPEGRPDDAATWMHLPAPAGERAPRHGPLPESDPPPVPEPGPDPARQPLPDPDLPDPDLPDPDLPDPDPWPEPVAERTVERLLPAFTEPEPPAPARGFPAATETGVVPAAPARAAGETGTFPPGELRRPRRDPDPPTRGSAIIDLSSRKRPRGPRP